MPPLHHKAPKIRNEHSGDVYVMLHVSPLCVLITADNKHHRIHLDHKRRLQS